MKGLAKSWIVLLTLTAFLSSTMGMAAPAKAAPKARAVASSEVDADPFADQEAGTLKTEKPVRVAGSSAATATKQPTSPSTLSYYLVPFDVEVTPAVEAKVKAREMESIELRWYPDNGFPGCIEPYFVAVHHKPGRPEEYLGGDILKATVPSGGEPLVVRGLTYEDYFATETSLQVDAAKIWAVHGKEGQRYAITVGAVALTVAVFIGSALLLRRGIKLPRGLAERRAAAMGITDARRIEQLRRFRVPILTKAADRIIRVNTKPNFAGVFTWFGEFGALSAESVFVHLKSGSLFFKEEIMVRNWLSMVMASGELAVQRGEVYNSTKLKIAETIKNLDSMEEGKQKEALAGEKLAQQHIPSAVFDVQNTAPTLEEAADAFRMLFNDFKIKQLAEGDVKLQ